MFNIYNVTNAKLHFFDNFISVAKEEISQNIMWLTINV